MIAITEKNIFYGCLGVLVFILGISNFIIFPVILQMIVYTFPIIYVGSHLSLKQNEVDPITGEMPNKSEAMNHKEAMLFPIFGSIALCTLYMAYKFLQPYYVNILVTTYLIAIGVIATAETLELIVGPLWCKFFTAEIALSGQLTSWPFGTPAEPYALKVTWHSLLSYILAIVSGVTWMMTKSWVIHNVFAISFCIQAISLVSVGSFKVACVLLAGLFVYDIFWVFGTEVMVTVALAFEGPAKLIFPVRFDPWAQSILGLGDIVIPGIFVSMCLRFDNYMHDMMEERLRKKNDEGGKVEAKDLSCIDIHAKFGKFYFWVVMIFYELGLITTGLVMYIFQHAQPALLYLVPFCIFSLFGAAIFNGEVKDVLEFKEDKISPNDPNDEGATESKGDQTSASTSLDDYQVGNEKNKEDSKGIELSSATTD